MTSFQIDYRSFTLRGNHYDIGHRLGCKSPQFHVPSWWPLPPNLDFAEACAREIALIHPPLLDEMQGYADGQGQPYEDFLRVICRRRLSGRIPRAQETGGCTSFVWRADDGHIMVGRNYDFHPMQRVRQQIHNFPDDGYSSIGMRGSVPVGRYDGVNSQGLFVSLHIVMSDPPHDPRPGIPFHLIPRLLLETCATAKEAINALMLMPHLHSFNYLVADADQFAVVETHHDRARIVYPTDDDLLIVGNFYQHPQMAVFTGSRKQTVPRRRAAFLNEFLRQQHKDAWQATQSALRDRTAPVCGVEGQHTTLWSCVVDLTARRLAYARGNPLETDYEELSWGAKV
jgi:predicted choloylglycine hydrolase